MGKKPKKVTKDEWRFTLRLRAELQQTVEETVSKLDRRTVSWWIEKAIEEKLTRDTVTA